MKRILLAVMMLATLSACADVRVNLNKKESVEERRQLAGFERIEQLGSIDVKYQQADSFSVVVKAPKRVIGQVLTQVEGNKLVVSMKGRNISVGLNSSDGVIVYVTSPDFLGIDLKGSGDFECMKPLDTDNLDIRLKGSGDINFKDIICDKINVSLVGSGDIELKKVETRVSAIELVGSGDIKMNQQKVVLTKMELKGSGDIKMKMKDCDKVDARLVGSGDITLTGRVASLQQYKRGSGEIKIRNEE